MKKLFFTLLFLFLIYFSLQALFYFFGPGHTISYSVDGYEIKEEYVNKQKGENQVYNLTINDGTNDFYLQIFKDFDNQTKIVKEIKNYRDNSISCIMPIFIDDKAATDLMCINDGIIYNASYLKENYPHDDNKGNIDDIYNSLEKYLTKENLESQDVRNTITLYKNNMQPNYYFSLASYKGFIYANPTKKLLYANNIYTNDVYDNYLSAYVNKYFVTVNYDEQYGYTKIYAYDITNNEERVIRLSKNIEKNSYIQGVYKNSLYIFDRDNKVQYEIDVENKTALEVGNTATGAGIYKNGKMERVSAYECANRDIFFEDDEVIVGDYKLVASTKGTKTGYSYYAKQSGETYQIYRVNNSNKEQYMYLFDTKYTDKLIALNEYVYFLEDGYIKYYSDHTGIRTLAFNSELNFNQNIEYQIIYQK